MHVKYELSMISMEFTSSVSITSMDMSSGGKTSNNRVSAYKLVPSTVYAITSFSESTRLTPYARKQNFFFGNFDVRLLIVRFDVQLFRSCSAVVTARRFDRGCFALLTPTIVYFLVNKQV